jgi:hypothetical protein
LLVVDLLLVVERCLVHSSSSSGSVGVLLLVDRAWAGDAQARSALLPPRG